MYPNKTYKPAKFGMGMDMNTGIAQLVSNPPHCHPYLYPLAPLGALIGFEPDGGASAPFLWPGQRLGGEALYPPPFPSSPPQRKTNQKP